MATPSPTALSGGSRRSLLVVADRGLTRRYLAGRGGPQPVTEVKGLKAGSRQIAAGRGVSWPTTAGHNAPQRIVAGGDATMAHRRFCLARTQSFDSFHSSESASALRPIWGCVRAHGPSPSALPALDRSAAMRVQILTEPSKSGGSPAPNMYMGCALDSQPDFSFQRRLIMWVSAEKGPSQMPALKP